jgi:hypothetical protein
VWKALAIPILARMKDVVSFFLPGIKSSRRFHLQIFHWFIAARRNFQGHSPRENPTPPPSTLLLNAEPVYKN